MTLRWIAALDTIEAFGPRAGDLVGVLRKLASAVERALSEIPALVPVAGLQARGPGWANARSIFTFAVREAAAPRRLLAAAELRPLYEQLARDGILLGQSILDRSAGCGWRSAPAASFDAGAAGRLDLVLDALADITASSTSWRAVAAVGSD